MPFFDPHSRPRAGWRKRVYTVIFETDTPAGKLFDIALLVTIVASIVVISLETVESLGDRQRLVLRVLEWLLTGLFTVEYVLRLIVVDKPRRYALSMLGLIDLLSILPTYLSLFFDDAQTLQVIRALRLFRVFRIFQAGGLGEEASTLMRALAASRYKIAVFLGAVLVIVVIQGALLYYVEHGVNESFSSLPRAVYWAIVTLTTVGYGDISPVTVPGQFIASALMLLGYGIIAVPTGIVTAEVALSEIARREREREAAVFIASAAPGTCTGPVPAGLVGGSGLTARGTRDSCGESDEAAAVASAVSATFSRV